jgi:hypothetical protein
MTIRIEENIAWLEGACGVAEAEPLFAALSIGRVTKADLSACREMHAAVAQVLIRFDVVITGAAPDPFLRDFVAPALERRRARAQMSSEGDYVRSLE